MDTKGRIQHPAFIIPATFGTAPTLQICNPPSSRFFSPVNPMANEWCYGNRNRESQGGLGCKNSFYSIMVTESLVSGRLQATTHWNILCRSKCFYQIYLPVLSNHLLQNSKVSYCYDGFHFQLLYGSFKSHRYSSKSYKTLPKIDFSKQSTAVKIMLSSSRICFEDSYSKEI